MVEDFSTFIEKILSAPSQLIRFTVTMDDLIDEVEHNGYSIRYADGEEGVRCVAVDDMIEWLLSIVDGDAANEAQCELVKIITDRLIEIKNL